jgi:putative membrane protein
VLRHWFISWLLKAVSIMIVAGLLPGIQVSGFAAAFIAAAVMAVASATLGLILKVVLFPFAILTLGLVYLLVNGLMLKVTSEVVPGFRVNGCSSAVIGAILLSIVDYVLRSIAGYY